MYTPEGYSLTPFISDNRKTSFPKADMVIDESKDYMAIMETSKGRMVIDLYQDKTPKTVNNFSQTRKFKQLLSNNFIQERAVDFYAEQMHMSVTHLHNIVKETTGLTPGQLIRNEVVLEAKRLLTHTDLSAAEVGYKLEFDDPAYFGGYINENFVALVNAVNLNRSDYDSLARHSLESSFVDTADKRNLLSRLNDYCRAS